MSTHRYREVIDDGDQGDRAARRRRVVLAGHRGDAEAPTRALSDPDPAVRAAALGALGRSGRGLGPLAMATALADPVAVVRRRACELSADLPEVDLVPLLADGDPLVVEAACWALGEREAEPGGRAAPVVEALAAVVTAHADPICREAAVAALGALGDWRGLDAILRATTDKPAVRRRAVLALAPFEGPEVDAALERALSDRDWQVRQAAEDLTGRRG